MLGDLFVKSNKDLAAPILLKLGVVITAWTYFGRFASHVTRHGAVAAIDPLGWAFGAGMNVLGLLLAVAVWNMKRWAVLGLMGLAAINLLLAAQTGASIWFVGAVRLLPLIPAAVYWRRLTWT